MRPARKNAKPHGTYPSLLTQKSPGTRLSRAFFAAFHLFAMRRRSRNPNLPPGHHGTKLTAYGSHPTTQAERSESFETTSAGSHYANRDCREVFAAAGSRV